MATDHSILPFPTDIDRDLFGAWLSGFVDGEGCFFMKLQTYRYAPCCDTRFMLSVRTDDRPVLRLIQSFWQCGRLQDSHRNKPKITPMTHYLVIRISHLANTVVPHFERYPLFAKKRNDFLIWKRGVEIHYASSLREPRYRSGGKGQMPKTTSAERNEYATLAAQLRQQRKFQAIGEESVATKEAKQEPPGLFDWI